MHQYVQNGMGPQDIVDAWRLDGELKRARPFGIMMLPRDAFAVACVLDAARAALEAEQVDDGPTGKAVQRTLTLLRAGLPAETHELIGRRKFWGK